MLSVPFGRGPDGQLQLHATTVSLDGKGVVLAGPSGCGKSSLALKLIALGAELAADDISWIERSDEAVMVHCPPQIAGQIEARGIGILNAPAAGPVPIHLVVDLGQIETERVPPRRTVHLQGTTVPLLHKVETPYFAESISHYIQHGLADTPPS